MGDAIVVEGLVKRYGDMTALDGIDLTVPRGTVLGLLGPNGAGKTTAVRVLTTLLRPDTGRVDVAGIDVLADPAGVRSRIGLAGQSAAVDETLTGRENLVLVGRLCGFGKSDARARADALLDRFALTDAGGRARRPTPEACADGSTSRPHWSTSRRCCSSTSPRRVSTRAAATTSGPSSRSSSPTAARCC